MDCICTCNKSDAVPNSQLRRSYELPTPSYSFSSSTELTYGSLQKIDCFLCRLVLQDGGRYIR
eukprot:COSAG02_NODE_365_length_23749_cov_13.908584_17_plen_63_part_00